MESSNPTSSPEPSPPRRRRVRPAHLITLILAAAFVIIAAYITQPRFASAVDATLYQYGLINQHPDTNTRNLIITLNAVNDALQKYHRQHKGRYPTLKQMKTHWSVLITNTNADGNIFHEGATPTDFPLGPYLPNPAMNIFTGSTLVISPNEKPTRHDGWIYNPDTGHIKPVGFNLKTYTFKMPGD